MVLDEATHHGLYLRTADVDLFLLLVQDGESNIATEFFGSSLIRSGIRSPNFQSKTEQRISCFYLLNKKMA